MGNYFYYDNLSVEHCSPTLEHAVECIRDDEYGVLDGKIFEICQCEEDEIAYADLLIDGVSYIIIDEYFFNERTQNIDYGW